MQYDTALKRMKELQVQGDPEAAHSEADNILCELLIELGYAEIIEEWKKVAKWYA